MTLPSQILKLAAVYRQSIRARAAHNLKNARLMTFTIALFLSAYLVGGYFLFTAGLRFVATVPGVGPLLLERVIYLLHFFFLVMLILSNSVLLYGAVFRGKETPWLITLPLDPRAIFCWKVIESLIVSSWGVVVLSAPILASIATVLGADAGFYIRTLAIYVPFLLLPAALGGILTMLLVRWWGRVAKLALVVLAGWLVWRTIGGWIASQEMLHARGPRNLSAAFERLLGHTDICMNRLVPSSWVSSLVVSWARGYGSAGQGLFFSMLLLSWALFAGWLCCVLVSRETHLAWNLSQRRRALAAKRQSKLTADGLPFSNRRKLPWLSRRDDSLIWKDLLEFRRDPGQWIPCLIVFSLLLLYACNLDNLGAMSDQKLFRFGIRYLNFGVCCLTLSTLTTRFIYPLFSLEGRRLWILGLAPFRFERVYWQKLLLFASCVALATGGLMLISGTNLGLSGGDLALYSGSVILMSVGLTAMALALGVLFPNFHSPSPARIVSGFGGTLCLILSLVYIILFMASLILPGMMIEINLGADHPSAGWIRGGSVAGIILLTAIFAGAPTFFALRRMKRVELLGNL